MASRPDRFPITPAVAVDVVALAVVDGALQVLVIRRRNDPFAGAWALPGGFVEIGESLPQAAAREFREETGVSPAHLVQLGAYGDPGRDPRGHCVSVVFIAALPAPVEPRAGDDAAHAEWVPLARFTGRGRRLPLAFDHAGILGDAVDRLARDLETSDLAMAFVPPRFTLAQLRGVYEAVWGVALDPANFRRKVLASPDFVVPTGEFATSGPEGGKPAQRYRRGRAGRLDPPLRRPAP